METNKDVSYVDIEAYAGDNNNQYELIDIEKTSNGTDGDCYYVGDDFKWEDGVIYHVKEEVSFFSSNTNTLKSLAGLSAF